MNPGEFLAKLKPHLIFVGAFLFAIVVNITIGFMKGDTLPSAAWRGISEIRPMEYALFVLFWYFCAVHRPKDDWGSSFISLNLSGSKRKK